MLFKRIPGLLIRKALNLSTKGLSLGTHMTRYYTYSHLESTLKFINKKTLGNRILSISGSLKLCELLHIRNAEIIEANYPQCNILKLPFRNNEFDYLVCDFVFEHIEGNPQQAIDESHRVLKQDGIAIFTSCVMCPIHGAPGDFWRYTPQGLTLLFRKFSEIIDVDGWGNFCVLFFMRFGLGHQPIPHAKWHPLHKIAVRNDRNWPIITWIVARK